MNTIFSFVKSVKMPSLFSKHVEIIPCVRVRVCVCVCVCVYVFIAIVALRLKIAQR